MTTSEIRTIEHNGRTVTIEITMYVYNKYGRPLPAQSYLDTATMFNSDQVIAKVAKAEKMFVAQVIGGWKMGVNSVGRKTRKGAFDALVYGLQ